MLDSKESAQQYRLSELLIFCVSELGFYILQRVNKKVANQIPQMIKSYIRKVFQEEMSLNDF